MYFSNSSKPIVNGAHLCEELAQFLAENKSDFEHKLIPDLSHIDHMAHNVNGIEIENISYVGCDQYQLDYSFDWEVYRGCSDMDEADIEHESVLFILNEDGFVDIDYPEVEGRDTRDEF